MTRKLMRSICVLAFASGLAACAGGMNKMAARQCPPINILATAERLPMGDSQAVLTSASLQCFSKSGTDKILLAKVTLRGQAAKGTKLPVFVAALDRQDDIVTRVQYRLTARNNKFALTLPPMEYGQAGDGKRVRLVAGFVLSGTQLGDNRAKYRKKLGLLD